MIWLKRRLLAADFAPFLRKLGELRLPAREADKFQMVSVDGQFPLEADYYISLPSDEFAPQFTGFERVDDANVPRQIDRVHLADRSNQGFKDRFEVKMRDRRRQIDL